MTMVPLEQLPAVLSRRNWLILAILLTASLPFGNMQVSSGVLAGGLVAITAFAWLQRSLNRLLADTGQDARTRYQFSYLIRLLALGLALAVLVAIVKIHPAGLILGLSVVIINLLWLALQRALR
jgi:hypothetical protein